MPCYLFTYHGYGTWMPDRERGYVRRKAAVLTTDFEMAVNYRRKQSQPTVFFGENIQELLIASVQDACVNIDLRCHAIATDSSHIHLLVSWKHDRSVASVIKAIKSRLTISLSARWGERTWFSKGSSRNRVHDLQHFDYLVKHYLPAHRGLGWIDKTGDA